MLLMQFYVQDDTYIVVRVLHMVLCACWICSVLYKWCYVHVGYVVLCIGGIVCMLYMWRYVHMMLCAWSHMWCSVHVALCTRCAGGDVYTWCYAHVVRVVAVYKWYWCRCMYCMVLYDVCRCMCVMHTMCMCTWLRRRHWVFFGSGNWSSVRTE